MEGERIPIFLLSWFVVEKVLLCLFSFFWLIFGVEENKNTSLFFVPFSFPLLLFSFFKMDSVTGMTDTAAGSSRNVEEDDVCVSVFADS